MLRVHKVKVASGYEVVVNGDLEDQVPVRVGREDQTYFVSFAPLLVEEKALAPCREGIEHEVCCAVRLQFQREDLTEILRGAGYSTYRAPVQVTVEEFVARQNLLQELRANIQSHVQAAGFFQLADQDATRKSLHEAIVSRCQAVGLVAEVVSCSVTPVMPEPALLAQLGAKALTQPPFKRIVEYFQETMRRTAFLEAEREEAKVQAQQQIIKARTDLKVFAIEENDRVSESEQQSKAKAEERQTADQERNARLKAHNAELEFQYRDQRLDEDKSMAEKELEVAKARELSEVERRESRRQEMALELDHERHLSQIRQQEIVAILQTLKEMPVPDYSGLSTLITDGAVGHQQPRDLTGGLLLTLLGGLTDSIGAVGRRTEANRRPALARTAPTIDRPEDTAAGTSGLQ